MQKLLANLWLKLLNFRWKGCYERSTYADNCLGSAAYLDSILLFVGKPG